MVSFLSYTEQAELCTYKLQFDVQFQPYNIVTKCQILEHKTKNKLRLRLNKASFDSNSCFLSSCYLYKSGRGKGVVRLPYMSNFLTFLPTSVQVREIFSTYCEVCTNGVSPFGRNSIPSKRRTGLCRGIR